MRIVDIVRPHMTTRDSNFRPATLVEKKVAASLWRLATGECYRSISITLGMGESSAETYTQLFCDTMFASRSEYIKFPPLNELRNVVNSFSEKTKIPNVVGAIDGSHIPIKAPTVNKECYFNRKHRYSILLQGVVEPNLKFYDAFAGVPGSVHDARLLRISKFGKKMESFRMLQEPKFTLEEGVELKPIILGDSAYAVKSWLLPPYTRLSRMPPTKKEFNNEHARGREPVERAFGHLKGRWRVLMNERNVEGINERKQRGDQTR